MKLSLSSCKLFDLKVSGNVRMNAEKPSKDGIYNPLDISNYIIREGGIISSDEKFENLEFDLIRADGTREIWWKGPGNILNLNLVSWKE